MKRRITFVQSIDAGFDPQQAVLTTSSLSVRDLDAAREDRITVGLDELPDELRGVFEQSHELHLRWASERSYDAVAPFTSRVSPGLHVHYTPLTSDSSSEALCTLLRTVVAPNQDSQYKNCLKPEDSFITPPLLSTRFASSASFQYHTQLTSIESLVKYIQTAVCGKSDVHGTECHTWAHALVSADSVDIDYDSISHALTVSGLWTRPPTGGWTDQFDTPTSTTDQIEFGLLGAEPGLEPEEIKMGGLLAVVGQDKKLKPTMFSFPSRHQPLIEPASYTVSFAPPTGLHPMMSISMPRSSLKRPPAPSEATCALHTYLTLPSNIFGDQFQLGTTDPLFLESHNIVALRALAGEMDLEAPDWVIQRWGSNWLLELATPEITDEASTPDSSNWTATIPLHLRYLPPSETGYRTAHVPWPVVFWACTAEDGTKMGVNPFDRTNLGWDGLFGPRTMFYQLQPTGERLIEDIDVPVLRLGEDGYFQGKHIELGTCVVISLGFLWVLWRLVRVTLSSGIGSNSGIKRIEEVHDKKE
ncbi:Glycosylphosphatidylinositol-mannosyltransferase I PIG-X/PBN1 [Penicillium paradoxum]|uniref:Glycosylphosphatidylinositol-mannosyltransferase I PIG-X/PBN1 n=1 Tax=Penicillium paradoxum TaxID=176176 RepID=UPI0025480571|nr:Glycosylphosphatidylinositol-mannosyltransferase I PIG-X/PBN1 [Penicillium paradoxum]KAJ5795077.1 Glycosylphosphatidylinositol-mannosyltransferase I PIG-X/PBN1 [Penicillium paradoxum]